MDLSNPVLQLCQQGMLAEAEGRPADARVLFEQAWASQADDYDACVAAHYLARHQDDVAQTLRWNQTALRHAVTVDDDRVAAFLPSLHVAVALAQESLGDTVAARGAFECASAHVGALPADGYGDQLRAAITAGLDRLG
ncbi:hypothetical protein [Asanoa sp. NPDC050611]|uniref:hypothetical protein n=1 Tax=Asanoa sp. NPDC050611 TaxID=3157098 RepID=UPI0033D0F90C